MDPEELKKKTEAEAAAKAAAAAGNPGGTPNGGGGAPPAVDVAALQKKIEEVEARAKAAEDARAKVEADAQKRIHELNQENAKHRTAKNEAEKKAQAEKEAALAQQGNYAALFEGKKAEAEELSKKVETLAQRAARLDQIEQRQKAEVEKAISDAAVPDHVKKSIEVALKHSDIDGAHEILTVFRGSATTTTVTPGGSTTPASKPSTPPGAAPPAPPPSKNIEDMTQKELDALAANPEAWKTAVGGGAGNGAAFNPAMWIAGKLPKA